MFTNYYRHHIVYVGDVADGPTCCAIHRTDSRSLAAILVEIGVFPSISEVRRNRRDLVRGVTGRERVRVGRRVIDIITEVTANDR